jgi:hypothetical protein
VGAGSLGLHVAAKLRDHNEWVILLDTEEDRIERAKGRDFEAFLACVDCQDDEIVPFMDKAKSLVCVYSSIEKIMRFAITLGRPMGLSMWSPV